MRKFTLLRVSLWLTGLLLLSLSAHAQYLSNGSFENYSACPNCHNSPSGNGGVQLASPWIGGGTGTPDYFNACFNGSPSGLCSPVDVPNNFASVTAGGQSQPIPAHHGNAYAGVFGYRDFGPDCEYIQIPLDQPLLAGNTYKASMWVRKAYSAPYSSNNLGMYFTSNLPSIASPPLNVTPQVLETNIINDTQNWTLVEGAFTAVGGEQYLTIGIFGGFQTSYGFPFNTGNGFVATDAYYLIDDVKVCDDPLQPLDPTFTYEIGCYQNQVTITATANTNYPNSQYNLYETQPCTGNPVGDPCLVQPPLDIQSGNVVTFTVPYVPGETYVIKHGNWDACRDWSEQRQLITVPDFEGSISTPSPICENEGVIITPTNIHPEPSQPWTLTVEGVVPGQSQGINPKTYFGCGDPGILDLSDPAGSGLYDTGLAACPTSLQPDGTPYPFTCDEVCEYYRIIIRYQVCTLYFSDTVIVHVLCAPKVESEANPDQVCPGDPVIYCVTNPQNALNYQWYDQNGSVAGGNTACTGPHFYQSGDAYYVVATDPSNGCSSTSIPQITEDPNCVDSSWCPNNLVPNSTFASYNPSCLSSFPVSPFFNGCVTAWSASNGSPQLQNAPQNPYAQLNSSNFGGDEGIFASAFLPNGLNVGGSINLNPSGNSGTLYIVAANGLTNSNGSTFPTVASQVLWTFDLSSLPSGWNTISLPQVVVNANYSQLAIHLVHNGGFFAKSRIKLDNLCLERLPFNCKMTVDAGRDQRVCLKTSTLLSGTVNGGVGPYTYQWSPATYLSNPTGQTTGFSPPFAASYLLTLTVTDANGCTASDQVVVTAQKCSKEREGLEGEGNVFSFSPNPASHQLNLNYQITEAAQLELYDLQGRVVMRRSLTAESHELSLSVSNLANGLYLARIRAKGGTLHQEKILIQR